MYALAKESFNPGGNFGATFPTVASSPRSDMSQQSHESSSTSDIGPPPASAASNVHSTLVLLRRLKKYTHNANIASFKLAEEFLGLASNVRRGLKYSAQVFADGNAVIVVRGASVDAQFEFMPDGVIAANIDVGDEEWDADIANFDGRTMPKAIATKFDAGV
ncbi:hypothetical protein MKK84_27960 [Methylobacterium sp. E-065]|uniref:hypothetical protein n=1 Tax=Methylobacterium sp. E-065 TaxID=2836583 RepID=UPI001FB9FD97|nr:hypothetical protein [Methylobacterium sp. E-065]MCJ2021207.1 hypothetical protein [Methylobacterium sp. E-065]